MFHYRWKIFYNGRLFRWVWNRFPPSIGLLSEIRTDVISASSDFGAMYTQKNSYFRDNGNATTVKNYSRVRNIENWVRQNYVGSLKPGSYPHRGRNQPGYACAGRKRNQRIHKTLMPWIARGGRWTMWIALIARHNNSRVTLLLAPGIIRR